MNKISYFSQVLAPAVWGQGHGLCGGTERGSVVQLRVHTVDSHPGSHNSTLAGVSSSPDPRTQQPTAICASIQGVRCHTHAYDVTCPVAPALPLRVLPQEVGVAGMSAPIWAPHC